MSKRTRKRAGQWRASPATIGGVVAGLAVIAVAITAYAILAGGGGSESSPVKTTSNAGPAQPFDGGPRLSADVDSVDLGHVPFNQVVSYAFEISNVGDAALNIEDVQVTMLEGC